MYGIFKNNRDFDFKDQIQSASVSISNNIAGGYERRSNKEFKQFLYIAKGSVGEVRSMSYIALRLQYINQNQFDNLYTKCVEISRLASGLIKTL